MYASARRGRQGIATLPSAGFRTTVGPDVSEYPDLERVSESVANLNLTVATLTPQVEDRIDLLLDEILIRGQFAENALEVVVYACALEKERDTRLLALVLDLMFQKLRNSPEVDVYNCVRLCQIIVTQILPTLHDQKTLDSNGQPIMGRGLFLKYSLDRFHLLAEQAWKTRESAVLVSHQDPKDSGNAERAVTCWLDLVEFSYGMWGRYMFGEPVVHAMIERQLSATSPTDLEISKLLTIIGPARRFVRDCKMKDRMDSHYSRVRELAKNDMISDKSRQSILYMLPKLNTAMVFSESLAQPNQNVVLDTTKLHPLATDYVPKPELFSSSEGAKEVISPQPSGGLQPPAPTFDPAVLEDDTFRITATTPLNLVIAFFTQFADTPVDDYTSELKNASYVSSDPIITSPSSDIYRATLRKGMHIAVKCVRTAVSGNHKILKHTVQELGVWSTLRHANILRLLGIALFKDRLAMVSEWMEQGSIISALKSRPELDRYALCIQVVGVVVWLHEQKLIHGDLKGANILMSEDGTPKLTDFGLAVMQEQILKFSTTYQGGGTMRWMAPELFLSNPSRSYKTDVYALGMTILEILTCQDPFQEIQNGHEIMYAVTVRKRAPRRPEYLAEKTPCNEMFWTAMGRCWVHEPNERATAQEIADLLDSVGGIPEEGKSAKKPSSLCCTVS